MVLGALMTRYLMLRDELIFYKYFKIKETKLLPSEAPVEHIIYNGRCSLSSYLVQDLEHTIAGTSLYILGPRDDIEGIIEAAMEDINSIIDRIHKIGMGVSVQASTLGSLESLFEFLKTPDRQSKIPVSTTNIGPVHKKDVMKASDMIDGIAVIKKAIEKEAIASDLQNRLNQVKKKTSGSARQDDTVSFCKIKSSFLKKPIHPRKLTRLENEKTKMTV